MPDAALAAYHAVAAELTADGARFEIRAAEPFRIFSQAPASLSDVYETAAVKFADRALAIEGEQLLTFAQALSQARRLGLALQRDYGIRPGDRVGIACRNRPEWFVAFMAITRIGAVAVLLNGRQSPEETGKAVSDVPCKIFVADEKRADLLKRAGCSQPVIVIADDAGGTFAALVEEGREEGEAVAISDDMAVAILFTSGTTGRPKGAVLSQRNVCQMTHVTEYFGALSRGIAARLSGMSPADIERLTPPLATLVIYPLFHVSGLTAFLLALLNGGAIVTMRRWNGAEAMDIIERRGITTVSGPALVLSDLLDQPDADARMARVMSVSVGGQATPASLSARISRMLPQAQRGNGLGMTETSGMISAFAGALYHARPGSLGPVFPIIDTRVVDEEERVLPAGETGELQLRSALNMTHYLNAPEANAQAFVDGWFRTGDIARIDEDGFLHLVDRKKDIVICGGENISCSEVERILSGVDALAEVALFGVPDERLGERPVAAATVRPNARCTAEELIALAREKLADYKVPHEVLFDLGPLPRNAVGKIEKGPLRSLYMSRMKEAK